MTTHRIESRFLWNMSDILSGRRRHWNRTCVPVLIDRYRRTDAIEGPMQIAIRKLLAATWTALQADFSQGSFKKWQKTLDEKRTARLLGIYMAHLLETCSARGVWEQFGLSEAEVWDAVSIVLPEVLQEQPLASAEGEELARRLSCLYVSLLTVISETGMTVDPFSVDAVFLSVYHPRLFIDLSESVELQIYDGLGRVGPKDPNEPA